jgi:hypothetical protein
VFRNNYFFILTSDRRKRALSNMVFLTRRSVHLSRDCHRQYRSFSEQHSILHFQPCRRRQEQKLGSYTTNNRASDSCCPFYNSLRPKSYTRIARFIHYFAAPNKSLMPSRSTRFSFQLHSKSRFVIICTPDFQPSLLINLNRSIGFLSESFFSQRLRLYECPFSFLPSSP